MTDYKISKEQCQAAISGVCSHCGGALVPIETVDNAGDPTFWAGCESCSRFEPGVSPEIFKAAEKLVTQFGYKHYSHMDERSDDSEETKKYNQSCQISGACSIVRQVLRITGDALEQATRWRSIKSAPKDGTEILGWREDCGHLIIRWDCAESFLTESEIEAGGWNDDNLFEEDWFCADFVSGSRLDGSEAPTHWMPLPLFAGDSLLDDGEKQAAALSEIDR